MDFGSFLRHRFILKIRIVNPTEQLKNSNSEERVRYKKYTQLRTFYGGTHLE